MILVATDLVEQRKAGGTAGTVPQVGVRQIRKPRLALPPVQERAATAQRHGVSGTEPLLSIWVSEITRVEAGAIRPLGDRLQI
mmetsp:Transcript_60364/g.127880  ORF Transcript_60364/g.127880 Transcript_60364/m.127880 type:complete len:83 (+) Transcript_60364:433-681(+)